MPEKEMVSEVLTNSSDTLTDGRENGHWETRYPDLVAKKQINFEAFYVTFFW